MKYAFHLMKCCCITILCGILLAGCRKNNNPSDPGNDDLANPNVISTHLQFYKAVKKTGKPPAAPDQSSLKISFKDTLYLMEDIKVPVKFLHDSLKNVGGIYIQVKGKGAGIFEANEYYDVPEFSQTANNDSVSLSMVGFDPDGYTLPFSFPVTITPYDEDGLPLDATDAVITVEESNDAPSITGPCGFINPQNFLQWVYSLTKKADTVDFFSSPDMRYGGQTLQGCCNRVNGQSGCAPGQTPNESLFFPTYFQMNYELFRFFDNGTFTRLTLETHREPQPEISNFCGVNYGIVRVNNEDGVHIGNWTLDPATHNLRLQGVSSVPAGSGWGNPGGILRTNCHWIHMVQLSGAPLQKLYIRLRPTDQEYYVFD